MIGKSSLIKPRLQVESELAPSRTASVLAKAVRAALSYGLLLGLVAIALILASVSPTFLTRTNLLNVALQASVVAVMAFGEAFVILTAGIDLSVGSVLGLTGVVMASTTNHFGTPLGILTGLALGAMLGTVSGLFITQAKMAPFIATLAMLAIGRGLTYVFTNGQPILVHSPTFNFFGQGSVVDVPVPVILMFAIFAVCWVILTQTRFGRYVLAIGGNPEVTRLSGIAIRRYVTMVYALTGLLAAVGGLILTARLGTGDPNGGIGYELDVIAAVVIGGTSLAGGRGSVFRTLLGALIMAVVANGLVLLNVNPFWSQAVRGCIILVAVLAD